MSKIIGRTEIELTVHINTDTTKIQHTVTHEVNHDIVDWSNPNQVLNWYNKIVLEKIKYNVVDYKSVDIVPNLHEFEYWEITTKNRRSATIVVDSNFWRKTTNPKKITLNFLIMIDDVEVEHNMSWKRTRAQWTFWDWMEEINARDLIGMFSK